MKIGRHTDYCRMYGLHLHALCGRQCITLSSKYTQFYRFLLPNIHFLRQMRYHKIISVNVHKPMCERREVRILCLCFGAPPPPEIFEPVIIFMKLGGNLMIFVSNRHLKFFNPTPEKVPERRTWETLRWQMTLKNILVTGTWNIYRYGVCRPKLTQTRQKIM
jgi:hypothetical protein